MIRVWVSIISYHTLSLNHLDFISANLELHMKFNSIIILLFLLLLNNSITAQNSKLKKQGNATQLLVNDKPFIVLGGELGNSSASSIEDIEAIFPKLKRIGLNTVLVPAYWDLVEPMQGQFDFQLTDKVIEQARQNDLKVIFLWFGAWKNSMSCYTPLWFKEDYERYPRAYTKEGKPLEIASAFSENVLQADNNAFMQWLNHISTIDKEQGTVIMIQIENEIGMLEDARDYSEIANSLFSVHVPTLLMNYLKDNYTQLHPVLKQKWEEHGLKMQGNWQEVFGNDLYTDEIFMAWYYANYVERLALTARKLYDVPLYVNAAMNSRNRKPGEYPSAGPLAHLIDIWHCGAPNIDFLAPDLYDNGFVDWTAQYKLPNNPLFIPESKATENNGVRAFYILGEHDAIGFSPFSIEDCSDSSSSSFVRGYNKLNEIMPLITKYQGKGNMNGLLFDQENKERILNNNGIRLICRHNFTLPWDARATDGSVWPEGGGIIIQLSPMEYIISGNGIVVEFENEAIDLISVNKDLGEDGFVNEGNLMNHENKSNLWNGKSRIGLGSVDEVNVNQDGSFSYIRRLNGDQTHQGRHARISVGDYKTLHVKLYEYK